MEEVFKSIFSKVNAVIFLCKLPFCICKNAAFVKKKIVFILYFQQWEVKAPMPSQAMRSAVKQITKLHESLSAVLPGAHVEAS